MFKKHAPFLNWLTNEPMCCCLKSSDVVVGFRIQNCYFYNNSKQKNSRQQNHTFCLSIMSINYGQK